MASRRCLLLSLAAIVPTYFTSLAHGAGDALPDRPTSSDWLCADGSWTNARCWSAGVPNGWQSAIVRGQGHVTVTQPGQVVADVKIGFHDRDRSAVVVDGGELVLVQDSLRVGEFSGGSGEFVLKRGAMHCVMDVFVGGANAVAGTACEASASIQGGSFVGRSLTLGNGRGSHASFSVIGSRATAVHLLDYLYVEGTAEPGGRGGDAELRFVLDERGVTPITLQSERDGLRIIKDANSQCRLTVELSAPPPADDITLVAAHVATQGIFDGMGEGAKVTATFGGHSYRWSLTYRGGMSRHDLVLRPRDGFADVVTMARDVPAPPTPLWTKYRLYPLALPGGQAAFPGAEGYGAYASGGQGGRVIDVTTLADAGPGSLREAVTAPGARTIRFRVGGAVDLAEPLVITEPYLTIDGSEAPDGGIVLRRHGIEIHTHDVVLRHFRVRVGDAGVRADDPAYRAGIGDTALQFLEGAANCIADHLSLSWTPNKVVTISKMADRITVQWCILSESLNFAGHGYGAIAGGNRVTWHHNLFAHHQSRNPRFQGAVDADFRYNVVYDWGDTAGYGEFDRLNYVGNYLKPGPSTTQRPALFHNGAEVVAAESLFAAGNAIVGDTRATQDNWRGMGYWRDRETVAAPEPFPAPPVSAQPADGAYEAVLNDAGATLPQRDAVDQRVVTEVRTGTGHIIKTVAEVTGTGR